MAYRTSATFTSKGALDTATVPSPLTFPAGGAPLSATRGVVPRITNLKKRHVLPHAVCGVAPVEADRLATLSFEMEDVSAPFANMLRRVILTEVPTMAIDRVLIHENDGVVLDELLSHRLGLCPIAAPAEAFQFLTLADTPDFSAPSGKHVLRFDLDVAVPNDPSAPPVTNVYSSSLTWVPLAGQETLAERGEVRVVQTDILLAKLGRGQRIKLQAYAIKGLGLTHAKWAPCSACWYDMRTEVTLTKTLKGEQAHRVVESCPMRVYEIEDGVAIVARPEKCTLCRECIKEENADLGAVVSKDKTRVKFTVESLGQYPHPELLVRQALTTFAHRCRNLKQLVVACDVSDPK
jgi:DNA-directed RNA polymerase I and III subunit RPAC1